VTGLRRRAVEIGAAVASALLLFVAGEPVGFGVLAWVALVPLFAVVASVERARWAWLYGFLFGLVFFGIHLSWIFLFGWMAWTALTIAMALYTSAATFVAGLVRRSTLAPLMAAGAWTGMELVRDRWPVGGFPWGAVGTTQVSVPGVRWLAGVVGVYGLSFLVAFAAWLVAGRRWEWRSVAVAAAVLVVFVAVDAVMYGAPSSGRPVRVAVVQGGVPRPPRPDQNEVILGNHIRVSRELIARRGPVDVVVWPESAIANSVADSGLAAVKALALETNTSFLVGRSYFTDDAYFNLVEHVTPDGRVEGEYAKRHPVPFGEYVPIAFLRDFVGTLQSEIPVDQRPGTKATVFNVEGRTIATPVCFESVFPRDFLDFVREGTELFVLSTNNSSFEHSYASQQHIAHTRMRALETRQWVVQAALAGISGVLGPDGSITHTTKLFTTTGFVSDVRARRSQSLYATIGDVFPSIFGALTVLGLAEALVRRRRGLKSTDERSE
jgi:apolipoprotein N-acyltransferase